MTTSLIGNYISHKPLSCFLDDFRNELTEVLVELAPRYINLIEAMDEYMLQHLYDTLWY